jgi:hypothetical protein
VGVRRLPQGRAAQASHGTYHRTAAYYPVSPLGPDLPFLR